MLVTVVFIARAHDINLFLASAYPLWPLWLGAPCILYVLLHLVAETFVGEVGLWMEFRRIRFALLLLLSEAPVNADFAVSPEKTKPQSVRIDISDGGMRPTFRKDRNYYPRSMPGIDGANTGWVDGVDEGRGRGLAPLLPRSPNPSLACSAASSSRPAPESGLEKTLSPRRGVHAYAHAHVVEAIAEAPARAVSQVEAQAIPRVA